MAMKAGAHHSAVIESDLRILFRIDEGWVTTLDVGTHKLYRSEGTVFCDSRSFLNSKRLGLTFSFSEIRH